jgi:hypothetical protein
MAHFNYIKGGGVWSLFSLLTSGIMSTIDKALYKSINGDEGGVWAPHLPGSMVPTPIIIGGDGLQVTGPFLAIDAAITITPGKYLTVDANATFNLLPGSTTAIDGFVGLGGTVIITGQGVIIDSTVGGIVVNGTGELWVQPSGIIRLKTAPGFGGGSLIIEGGANLFFEGAAGNLANLSASYANWLLGAGTSVNWGTGASAVFGGTSSAVFGTSTTLAVNGAMTSASTFTSGLNGAWFWNGTGSGQRVAVEWGPFSLMTADVGSLWNDYGSHKVFADWLFGGGSASLTMGAGTALTLNGTTNLTAVQPAPNTSPGANTLTSTAQCKAWAVIFVDGSAHVSVKDGYNIVTGPTAAGAYLVIQFVEDMASDMYVVTGHFVGPDHGGSVMGSGYLVAVDPTPAGFNLVAKIQQGNSAYDFSTGSGGYIVFAVFGRQ